MATASFQAQTDGVSTFVYFFGLDMWNPKDPNVLFNLLDDGDAELTAVPRSKVNVLGEYIHVHYSY